MRLSEVSLIQLFDLDWHSGWMDGWMGKFPGVLFATSSDVNMGNEGLKIT
jgi:hypothetical protein